MAEGSPRHPCERVVLVRHGLPDGPRHLFRSGSARSARAGRLGRGTRRSRRIAADNGRRRRPPPRDDRPRPPSRRDRQRLDSPRRGRRPGSHAHRGAAGDTSRRRSPGDRLRAGGRGEHGRVRLLRGGSSPVPRGRCLGTRRRCIRAVGRRLPDSARAHGRRRRAPTPGRPTRTSGSTSRTTAGSRSSPIRKRIEPR